MRTGLIRISAGFSLALVTLLIPEVSAAAVLENLRGEIIKDSIFFLVGEAVIIGVFYFGIYPFLLNTKFHHFVAHSITVALTCLYTLCLLTVLLLPYELLNFWQWIGIFLILGVAWLFMSVFLLVSARR
jgi:hypothetical protein